MGSTAFVVFQANHLLCNCKVPISKIETTQRLSNTFPTDSAPMNSVPMYIIWCVKKENE